MLYSASILSVFMLKYIKHGYTTESPHSLPFTTQYGTHLYVRTYLISKLGNSTAFSIRMVIPIYRAGSQYFKFLMYSCGDIRSIKEELFVAHYSLICVGEDFHINRT